MTIDAARGDNGRRARLWRPLSHVAVSHWWLCALTLLASLSFFSGDAFAEKALHWEREIAVLEDSECQLSVNDILANALRSCAWQPVGQRMLNFGFSSSSYWLRFPAQRLQAGESQYMLEIANHKVTHIDVFVLSSQDGVDAIEQQWSTGVEVPVHQRQFSHRHFVFPVTLDDNAPRTLLIRVESQYPLKLPVFWTPAAEFHQRNSLQTLFQGVYFGSILIMAFYNLFIYLVVRDRSYALYFVFMVVMALFLAVDRGIAYQYLWPGQLHTDYVAYVALMSFAAAWSVFFSVEFLSLREHLPRFARGFGYLARFWLLMTVVALGFASPALVIFEVLIVIPAGGALLAAGVIAWRKGVPAAPYYLIAWVVIIHGAVVYALTLVNMFPPGNYAEYALQVSSIAEAALLSLGLAHRIKTLDRERSMAYAAARAKTDFIATISHEIRTPMNGMLGMAQLLRETGVTEQQQRYVNTILSSGQALLTLLNDTLDFSKIEAKKLELECLGFDLRQLIDDSAAIFSLRAQEKGLRFFMDVDVHVPQRVMGDPTRVRQVLANLLSNAFKFTDRGGVTLSVSVSADGLQLEFSVQDTGLGMHSDTLERLFSPYVQASASTARKFGGTGLGLSICKHLVEMMGGNIDVSSQEGHGSRFCFSLPLTADTEGKDNSSEGGANASRYAALQVISTDAALVKMLAAYAKHLGMTFAAFDSLSALAAALPEKQSVVLLDSPGGAQGLSMLLPFGESGSGWLQCQWAIVVKPGERLQAIAGFAQPFWLYETPFSVSLFQQQICALPSDKPGAASPKVGTQVTRTYRGKRVLVVDDNPINSLVVCGFLNKLEIDSKVAHSAIEALEMLATAVSGFDLILMDCEMPGMNGYEATAEIRRREQQSGRERHRIVALSAHIMADHRQKCLDAGMDDVLTKPILFADLQTKVGALLQEASAPV